MNLVREILLALEACEHGYVSGNPVIDGYTEEQVGYHVFLMHQAGLIEAAIRRALGPLSPEGLAQHLTWAGHDFLDAAKNDTIWNRAKTTVLLPGAAFTFDLLKEWLKQQAKELIGLP